MGIELASGVYDGGHQGVLAIEETYHLHDADYLGTNAYWVETLTEQARYRSDDMLTNGEALQRLTPKDVQRIARRLIRSRHTAEVIMNGK